MKAIIFGANGQDGFYLKKLLEENSVSVVGVSRSGDFLRTDISSFDEVSSLIKDQQPDYIFHFAANSTTRHDALFENHHSIATGTLNILEAVKNFSPQSKVFISGSALQFENKGLPIKETDPFKANDAYAVSRIQSVYAARYFRSLGLKVYVGYFFNHDSPLRSERHVAMKICAVVKRISAGSDEILEIGDASVIKEWSFAGDAVKAVWLLVNQDEVFEANIGSGIGYSVAQWIEICFNLAGISSDQRVRQSSGFVSSYKTLICDPAIINSLGYIPPTDIRELAGLMINSA